MNGGRRVVITAAGAGIGLAIANAFAANGDRVHICDIDEQALTQITHDNPAITATVCDVSDRSAVGGRFGYPERSPYAVTKRGLIALTETLAFELGADGIPGRGRR